MAPFTPSHESHPIRTRICARRLIALGLGTATLSANGLAPALGSGPHSNTAATRLIITDSVVALFWPDRATDQSRPGSPVEPPTGEPQEE